MSISVNPAYRWCKRHKVNVSLEQTEGQCREAHNCDDSQCPLEGEFGQNTYARALRFLVPNLLEDWPTKE